MNAAFFPPRTIRMLAAPSAGLFVAGKIDQGAAASEKATPGGDDVGHKNSSRSLPVVKPNRVASSVQGDCLLAGQRLAVLQHAVELQQCVEQEPYAVDRRIERLGRMAPQEPFVVELRDGLSDEPTGGEQVESSWHHL